MSYQLHACGNLMEVSHDGVCMSYQLHAYGNLMEVSHDVSKLLLKLLIKQFKVNQCDLGRVVKAID